MNARITSVVTLLVVCLSTPSASHARSRTASSLRGAGWRATAPAVRQPVAAPIGIGSARDRALAPAAGAASRASVPDGSGGLYIAWSDFRDGDADMYVLRVTNAGLPATGWPADGVAVCDAPGDQFDPIVLPDGFNGVIVGWLDFRSSWRVPDGYAQRVGPSGTALWTPNGVNVVSGLDLFEAAAAPDQSGGLLVTWTKSNGTDRDIYATRRDANGALASGWTAGGVLVCGLPEEQTLPVVTWDGSGGAWVAWQDMRNASETHTYVQHLNATGAAQLGADGRLLDASAFGATSPSICDDSAGGAFVFWDDFTGSQCLVGQHLNAAGTELWAPGGLGFAGSEISEGHLGCVPDGLSGAIVAWQETPVSDVSIRAQRVNGASAAQWGTNGVQVVSIAGSYPNLQDVVPAAAGAAYFVWEDYRNSLDFTPDIYAQRIGSTGTVVWTLNGRAATTAPGDQAAPTGALDGADGLVVAWEDFSTDDEIIRAQRFNPLGTILLVPDGKEVYTYPGVQIGQAIVQSNDGGAFVVGNERRNGQWDIKARRFDADGNPLGPSVALCFAAGSQFLETAIDDAMGGVIAAWVDRRAGNDDIYVRRLDASGNPLWTADGVPVCVASGAQHSPRLVADGFGGVIVAWQDERDPSNPDIYAQHVTAGGNAHWTGNGHPVCNDPEGQYGVAIASDGLGGAIIGWEDERTPGSTALYAQRLNIDGNEQWSPNGENLATFASSMTTLSSIWISGAAEVSGSRAIFLVHRTSLDLTTFTFSHALHVQLTDDTGAAQWGTTGTTVCAVDFLTEEQIVGDGTGGAYVAWADGRGDVYDIYARRVDASGVAQWAADGVPVCDATGWQHLGSITRHSGGDLVLTWSDARGGAHPDIFAHRIGAATGADVWTVDGMPVCGAPRGQFFAALAPYKTASPERFFVAWTDNRAVTERYVYLQRLDASGNGVWAPNGITRTTLAMVSASAAPDRVFLTWHASDPVTATVYRRRPDEEWVALGQARSDGLGQVTFEDRDVAPGARYGYRLGYIHGGEEWFSDEVWVEIPAGVRLALDGLRPNPATKDLVVSFTLPRADDATLELLDVTGRRLMARHLTGLPAGRHTLRLEEARPPAGVVFLRLTQNGHSVSARGAVVR